MPLVDNYLKKKKQLRLVFFYKLFQFFCLEFFLSHSKAMFAAEPSGY